MAWSEGGSRGVSGRKAWGSWGGGFRVPFGVRWSGVIPPGITSDAISMNFDVFPTLLTLAGVSIPTDRVIDGKNILSVLDGSHASTNDYLYFIDIEKIKDVRSQRLKFIVFFSCRVW